MAEDITWEETLQRLGLSLNDVTQVNQSDIEWLAAHWQFLQIVDGSGNKSAFEKPEFIKAKSGWTIVHYGNAMATSPGKLLFGMGGGDDDEGGGGGLTGTYIKQAFDSACELIQLAKQFGWDVVEIIDGHPDMQEAAWMEACRIGVKLEGFEADVKSEKKRRRVASETIDEMHRALRNR